MDRRIYTRLLAKEDMADRLLSTRKLKEELEKVVWEYVENLKKWLNRS